jgi:hypothetical protein
MKSCELLEPTGGSENARLLCSTPNNFILAGLQN